MMLKLVVICCTLIAFGSAYPANELNESVVASDSGPTEDLDAGEQNSALVENGPAKEDLDRSESFGFGYKRYYPRYYGYHSYYHYPRYYHHYPRYYYW
ncbi:cuticle protein 7-like [Topomyia yanbarensis]|uniref:cuticle protein 7-like n=1 Tax=Topomyia yanbarensis TaxID=2498891 RepID=UPI00273C20CB|nr:cuticle protein 7-like [Topomyia yanbarensis]